MSKQFVSELFNAHQQSAVFFPDKEMAKAFVDGFFEFLFIPGKKTAQTEEKLNSELDGFKNNLFVLIHDVLGDDVKAKACSHEFFEQLPLIYAALLKDAATVLECDPAAKSQEEVLLTYPGFYAIAVYRIAHQLCSLGIGILPRLFTEYAHSKTGIDIHPAAIIGESFFIDHGTGIVIGETTRIGNNVKIYQSVTLGAVSVSKEQAKTKRHPTIEDNVVIYSGATILGGDTVVGHDSVIGGNVWLTASVLPYSVVYHKSEVSIRDKNNVSEALNFVI